MAMAHGRSLFHHSAAVVSLVLLLALLHHAAAVTIDLHLSHDAAPNATTSLPPRSSALAKAPAPNATMDVSSSSTAHLHDVAGFSDQRRAPASPQTVSDAKTVARRLLASPSAVARRQADQGIAAAPSPQAAPSPTRHAHARSATRTRHLYYGVSFADLHDACLRQNCAADYFHRLAAVLYGPHTGSGWDYDYDLYCVVRTVEGSQPILPGSWRAAVASGGDVCNVEVARMDRDTVRIHCWLAWTCSQRCTTDPGEALSFAIDAISTPCGGASRATTSGGVTRIAAPSLLNAALPLLAVAFLPRPLAAAVILSYLPSLVRAGLSEEEFLKLNHATCAVYPYDINTGAVERARPIPSLREMCLRPLCLDLDGEANKLRIYCAVHSLKGASSPSIFFPWRNTWRAHLPISDPEAAAASGDDVCYVELAHMDYRERYYISCPAGDGHSRLSCTEFPEEAVASAVRDHRKLTYVVPNCDTCRFSLFLL
ncbi:hypothetical protein EJB05_49902, partial [Eragrostis curvula]